MIEQPRADPRISVHPRAELRMRVQPRAEPRWLAGLEVVVEAIAMILDSGLLD